ncbi:MAG: DUF3299 domain-containing protein [Burkholderiaceae bacterium]
MTMPEDLSRRRLLAAALIATAGCFSRGAAATSYRELSWNDLIPKDWDPTKEFKDLQHLANASDFDPRVQQLYDRMREVWDKAPTVRELAGQAVRLPGYVVPLEEVKGAIQEFLLVPYFGACIHTPPPPANQIIHVRSASPVKGLRTMDAVWVSGTLDVKRADSLMGVSGYTLAAASVRKHTGTTGGR